MRCLHVALITLSVLAGCSNEKSTAPNSGPDIIAARRIPEEAASDVDQVVQGNNDFAFDLYAELRTRSGNLFISPYSISSALAMTWAGARTVTETEMADVLHLPFEQERLHLACGALQQSLATGLEFETYQLNIANRLWGQTGYSWLPSFLEVSQQNYGAGLVELDFYTASEASRVIINEWVANRTAQKIDELLPPSSISPGVVLVLTNAIYFKGDWASQFDQALTRDLGFFLSPTQTIAVPTMSQTAQFAHMRNSDLAVLEMPYDGKDLSMVFLLPKAVDGLSALEEQLTSANLATWLGELEVSEIAVALPRFEFSTEFKLRDPLVALGMPSAFNGQADFTGMRASGGLFIDEVYHEAFIRVDEEGSEAAGATAVVIREPSVGPEFAANHPFVFLIMDKVTGQILFLGRVVDPSA